MLAKKGLLAAAAALGVAPATAKRLAAGSPVTSGVITRAERITDKLRTADEFKSGAGQAAAIRPPRRNLKSLCWDIERVRTAREAQQRGDFALPAALATAVLTDDAIFTAYHNRLAPHDAITAALQPHDSVRGRALERKARRSCHMARSALKSIHGTLVQHGVAFGFIERETNREGTLVDFKLTEWPIEFVRWNTSTEQFETRTRDGGARIPIVHADGQWIIFRKFAVDPWSEEAALLAIALVWAAHAEGLGDWAASSNAHGLAKILGILPEGVALEGGEDGQDQDVLSPAAQAFLNMLQDLASGDASAGVAPHGGTVNFLANGSTAWQVFSELINNREKAAARIYLGTDAMLGSMGGAPGVDIAALFGVATTKLQSDFHALEEGVNVGLLQPWAAVNDGDSSLAPRLHYALPDPDAERNAEQYAKGIEHLTTGIKLLREQQLTVDQAVVDALAAAYGISPSPKLAKAAATPIDLAPTDVVEVVRVNEARGSRSLPLLPPEVGNLFVSQLKAKNAADAQAAGAAKEAAAKQAAGVAPAPATTPAA